ncbi:MAG: nitrate reductase [Betaproteobacteria bacterium]|nr:MAG: nitrate reductase [Betaproteobacteria bacterium]
MSAAALLEFARGPALWFSLGVLIAGSLWRVFAVWRLGARLDLSEPRSERYLAGALRGIFARMLIRKEFRNSRNLGSFNAYVYHVGLAFVVFGYLPHIRFVERLTGISWPALPAWVMYVAAGPTVVGLLIALLERLSDPVRRLLSGFDDYFSWLVAFLPLLTGMAAVNLAPAPAADGVALYPLPVAIHLLSVELMFLWLPFGKLGHAFLVFFSRGITGAALERKGAAI